MMLDENCPVSYARGQILEMEVSMVDETRAKEFGREIKALRTAMNMGVRELARATEISKTYLSYIEKGVHGPPSPEKVIKLAEALKENPDRLLTLAGHVDPTVAEWARQNQEAIGPSVRSASAAGDDLTGAAIALCLIGHAYSFAQMDKHEKLGESSPRSPDVTPVEIYKMFRGMMDRESTKNQKEYAALLSKFCRLWQADLKTRPDWDGDR
jgi:XRE family transcriptional regulator, master regulator for biofilm formation